MVLLLANGVENPFYHSWGSKLLTVPGEDLWSMTSCDLHIFTYEMLHGNKGYETAFGFGEDVSLSE